MSQISQSFSWVFRIGSFGLQAVRLLGVGRWVRSFSWPFVASRRSPWLDDWDVEAQGGLPARTSTTWASTITSTKAHGTTGHSLWLGGRKRRTTPRVVRGRSVTSLNSGCSCCCVFDWRVVFCVRSGEAEDRRATRVVRGSSRNVGWTWRPLTCRSTFGAFGARTFRPVRTPRQDCFGA